MAYGALNWVTFTATAIDFEDGAKCCKLTWDADKDGPLGAGSKVDFIFKTPGIRKITVTAQDLSGNLASTSIFVNAANSPPTVKINKPAAGAFLYKNVTYVFDGQGSDPNEPAFALPCKNLTWSSTVAGDQTREDRVGVKIRKAPPHQARRRVHQRGCTAVADHREIETMIHRHVDGPLAARSASHRRTSRGRPNVPVTPRALRPTE